MDGAQAGFIGPGSPFRGSNPQERRALCPALGTVSLTELSWDLAMKIPCQYPVQAGGCDPGRRQSESWLLVQGSDSARGPDTLPSVPHHAARPGGQTQFTRWPRVSSRNPVSPRPAPRGPAEAFATGERFQDLSVLTGQAFPRQLRPCSEAAAVETLWSGLTGLLRRAPALPLAPACAGLEP